MTSRRMLPHLFNFLLAYRTRRGNSRFLISGIKWRFAPQVPQCGSHDCRNVLTVLSFPSSASYICLSESCLFYSHTWFLIHIFIGPVHELSYVAVSSWLGAMWLVTNLCAGCFLVGVYPDIYLLLLFTVNSWPAVLVCAKSISGEDKWGACAGGPSWCWPINLWMYIQRAIQRYREMWPYMYY